MNATHFDATATNALETVPGATGRLKAIMIYNPHATDVAFCQIHVIGAVLGTTPPRLSLACEPGSSGWLIVDADIGDGISGIRYAVTATATGSGAPSSACQINVVAS